MIDREEIDWLAAQYALGALPPSERRMLKARLPHDPDLAGLVQEWETRLAPFSLREPGLVPPPRVLEGILSGIAQRHVDAQSDRIVAKPAFRTTRWGAAQLALAATIATIAISLGAIVLDRSRHSADVLAVLLVSEESSPTADEPGASTRATFAISLDRQAKALSVRQTAGDPPRADRIHVLWIQFDDAADAILIGHLHRSEPMVASISELSDHDIARGRLLITLETLGTVSRPRGPVVASGRFQRTR